MSIIRGLGLNSYLTNSDITQILSEINPDWVYDWGYKGASKVPNSIEYVPQLWGLSAYVDTELDTYLKPIINSKKQV